MKNPMNKRILREMKKDFAKYLVIFLFMVMLIGLVSAFLVANNSVRKAYDEGFEKYNLEDGHFVSASLVAPEVIEDIESENNIDLFELSYIEKQLKSNGANIRIYKDRAKVNLACLMSGQMPVKENEIALDRVFAQNAKLTIGDVINLGGKELTISGLVALPDYSCLFESNADMMFDSIHFSIAIMSAKGYNTIEQEDSIYCYAWKYRNTPENTVEEKEYADNLLDNLSEKVMLTGYVPRYLNQAINFTGEDMGGDAVLFTMFNYIVIVILAFIFAITTSNTITAEAGVIGTLRASGYTKGEIVRHYMVLPVVFTLIAAVIGNILGYTVFKWYMVDLLYDSYSLCTYETLWNARAFIDTTLIPVLLMFIINLTVLIKKMKLSPLQFLRKELYKNGKKRAVRLSSKIPFLQRFRLRVLFQNIPNYITLFAGIILSAFIVIFGMMFTPLLDEYAERVADSMICKYQYILKMPVETSTASAEKYCYESLNTLPGAYMEEEIAVFGIEENSSYIQADIPEGKVLLSNGYMDKFSLKAGDKITLKETYSDEMYEFEVGGEYTYDAAQAVFMNKEEFLKIFDKDADYFTGYFTNEKLDDIEEAYVAGIITKEDMLKLSNQLKVSMGSFMGLFKVFGAIMFLLMMFLLSKQVIEKNAQSISMTKILGFHNIEIGSLYIISTTLVVIASLLVAIPIVNQGLAWAFKGFIYTRMTGYIPYIIEDSVFIKMFLMGISCYTYVAILQMHKIRRIPMEKALKNME